VLQDFISKHVVENWHEQLLRVNENYSANRDNIEKSFVSAFEAACSNAARYIKQGLKGDIQYICISFLRTSIMENKALYRIDLYDRRWYLDTQECCVMWDADFIFSVLFKQIELLMIEKKQFGRMITDIDIDNVKLAEALKYHTLAIEFVRSMISRLMENTAYIDMGKTPEICIMMGEYRDFNEVLYMENEVK
jgi:hypothetical protein